MLYYIISTPLFFKKIFIPLLDFFFQSVIRSVFGRIRIHSALATCCFGALLFHNFRSFVHEFITVSITNLFTKTLNNLPTESNEEVKASQIRTNGKKV